MRENQLAMRPLGCALVALLLLSCGGGGSSEPGAAASVQAAPAAPAAPAQANLALTYARGYSLTRVGWFESAGQPNAAMLANVQNALNDSGQMAGYLTIQYSGCCTYTIATGGTPSFSLTANYCLGHNGPMPCDSQDTALNNAGRVVGYQLMGAPSYDESAAPTYHAFSGTTDLGTLGGTSSYATAINASDQVVGYSDLAANAGTQAFVYGNGSMHGLGTLGGAQSQAKAINDQGQIVGTSLAAGSATVHAFFYFSGKMSDLGEGQADAINQSGQVVGSAASGAFLTGAGGVGKTDLGSGAPIGINDAGQVVLNGAGAFLWDGAQQLDVNSLIAPTDPLIGSVKLTAVVAINNIGQILVDGHDASGWQQQYLLSPPHVAGQLATLGTLVMGAGPGQSLAGKASQAQSYYASADLPDTCRMLGALASDAMAQGGATIAQSLANELIVDVHVMMSTLGCPY